MSQTEGKFEVLTDAEHIRKRFSMYGGSQVLQEETVFIDAEFKEVKIVSGLLKIINEILDNSIDEHIRTEGKFSNKITVAIGDGISIADDGRGIPPVEIATPHGKMYRMVAAFTQARAGSNFDDDKRVGAGTNGVGSAITNVCSTSFKAISADGKESVNLECQNGDIISVKHSKSRKRGTTVSFVPDYEFFGLAGMDDTHAQIIIDRVKSLSTAFPSIRFQVMYKGETQSFHNTKFQEFFGECAEFKTELSEFGIAKSEGNFQSFSLVNGLGVKAGTHIDYFFNQIADEWIQELKKRKKVEITKARLKQHIKIFAILKNVKALKFDSQTKERVTNSVSEIKQSIGSMDIRKIVLSLMKDKNLIHEICEYSKLQDELTQDKELDKIKKQKVKSKKYFPAIGETSRIFVCEGDSAVGGLTPPIGRKGNAYYAMKGVPMNVLEITHQKLMANKEFTELLSIINNTVEMNEKPHTANWYELEINGEKILANETDEVLVDSQWIPVLSLVNENKPSRKLF